MYLKSPYPDVPPLPNVNAHYFFFKRPVHADWPNFTAHINAETGEKVMYYDFFERIRDLATGIGAPASQGGLGIVAEGKERVGIMGENSSVSLAGFLVRRMVYSIRFPGVHHLGACLYPSGYTLRPNLIIFNFFRVKTCIKSY